MITGMGAKPHAGPVGRPAPAVVKCARLAAPAQRMESHEQHQSRSVHHPAGNRRHVRGRHLDPLDRHRGRDGHPGKRRQRLRRRRRHRLHAAGGRAASERPRRRRADHRARHQTRPHRGDLRPGPGAGRRHHRALPQRGPGDGARHRAAGRLRSRHVRILDAAAARLRHDAAARRAGARDRLCPRRLSAGRARLAPPSQTVEQLFRKHWPTSAAVYLPNNEVPKPGTLFTNKTAFRNLCPHPEGGRERRRRPRRADRARAQGLVAWLRRRSDRQVLPHPGGHGRQRLAASRRADAPTTWRAGSRPSRRR